MLRNDTQALKKTVKRFRDFFDQFNDAFIEREDIVFRLMLALLNRQHLLVMGPPGTAKTAVSTQVFNNIIGDTTFFEVELTKFMTDDGLFGPYNVRKMREDGVLEHNVDGMLPEATFARLGEFLDANVATQRSLLSALNERQLKRGRQQIQMPLMTAYCDTNTDAARFLELHPDSWAVLDRLMFITSVGYVQTDANVAEMVKRYQSGRTRRIEHKLDFADIRDLSDLVVGQPSLFTDQLVQKYYGLAVVKYREERRKLLQDPKKRVGIIMPEISDRRVCIASQLAETAAVLDARLHVKFEDLLLCGHALGSTKQEFEVWKSVLDNLLNQFQQERATDITLAQNAALQAISAQLDLVDVSAADVDNTKRTLETIIAQLEEIPASDGAIEEGRTKLVQLCASKRTQLRDRILSSHGFVEGA